MKKLGILLLTAVAFPAFGQSVPFTIQILEDPRTKRDVTVAPEVRSPAVLDMKYAAEKPEARLSVQAWRQGGRTEFRGWSNYAMFVERAEILIRDGGATIARVPLVLGSAAQYGGAVPDSATYALRVYSPRGRYDQTRQKRMSKAGNDAPGRGELLYHAQENDLLRQNISLSGRAVTADGSGVVQGEFVSLNGYPIAVREDGAFEDTQIIPSGDQTLSLAVANREGRVLSSYTQPLTIADEDFFYVGIADVTVGKNQSSGAIISVTGDDSERFRDEIYVDGRLAFYLRGKVRGDWLLTAAADTGEGPIDDLFDNFLESDARSYLRRLDPDRYYPVYGDDSTAINDAPTDGKLYIQLEKDGSELLWGNYRTTSPGTRFTNFSRALYGARAKYVSPTTTEAGAPRVSGEVFAAEPGTLAAQEEFRGTGGSLYYLRNRDILRGSERIYVEVRDRDTGVLISRRQLTALEDYDVNAIQGRLQLRNPLGSTVSADTLVNSITSGGNPQYLVVRYEHSPSLAAADATVFGGSVEAWATERLRVGASAIKQQESGSDQTLLGVDATYQMAANSFVELEAARSKDTGVTVYTSLDGGFNFTSRPVGTGDAAMAKRVAVSVDLKDAGLGEGRASAFWQDREAGFSGPGEQTNEDVSQYGLDVAAKLNARLAARLTYEKTNKPSQTVEAAEIDLGYDVTPNTKVSVGLRQDDVTTRTANASNDLSTNGERLDGVVRVDFDSKRGWSAYGYLQGTIRATGSRAENNRAGVGGTFALSERVNVGGEVSTGDGGIGAQISGTWQVDERTQTYMSYSLAPDSADNRYRGQLGQFTYGGSRQVTDNIYVLAEQTYHHGDGPNGRVTSFGVDLTPGTGWSYGVRAEKGRLSDPLSGDIDREAISLSASFAQDQIRYSGVLEYRLDEGTERRKSWAFRNDLSYQVSDDWRFLGRLNFADSENGTTLGDTELVEVVTGFAYRPVENDRLNALFRYTYLYDTASPGQVSNGVASTFAQRSHVLSADMIYQFDNTFTLGGKVAARLGDIRQTGGSWSSSDAYLGTVRADIRLRPKWDVLAEWRTLRTPDAGDSYQQGALVGVYRRFNENFRAGLGYSDTDFSTDLTDQSYSSRGVFLNVIGKF